MRYSFLFFWFMQWEAMIKFLLWFMRWFSWFFVVWKKLNANGLVIMCASLFLREVTLSRSLRSLTSYAARGKPETARTLRLISCCSHLMCYGRLAGDSRPTFHNIYYSRRWAFVLVSVGSKLDLKNIDGLCLAENGSWLVHLGCCAFQLLPAVFQKQNRIVLSPEEIENFRGAGVNCFLIGEYFMRNNASTLKWCDRIYQVSSLRTYIRVGATMTRLQIQSPDLRLKIVPKRVENLGKSLIAPRRVNRRIRDEIWVF